MSEQPILSTPDRRSFLQTVLAGSFVTGVTGAARLAEENQAFAEAIVGTKPRRVGVIGSGWFGKFDVFRMMQVAPIEVVSICDPDRKMREEAATKIAERQNGKRPRLFHDYHKLLAEKDCDIVIVATPDHWHALPMIDAVKSGAHVYVEKPTSVDVVESRAMLAAARDSGKVVQVGTQRRSTPHLIDAKDRVIGAGLLGEIQYAEVCCYYHMRAKGNPPNTEPPEHLDYDLWTGPAPMRPYNELVHPRSWRAFTEYCNGIVGDMCVHMLDMVRWMLDLGPVRQVHSTGGIYVQTESKANTTDTQHATFEFDDFPVVWTHRTWGAAPDPDYPWAAFIYGTKGTLKASVHQYDFLPKGTTAGPIHRDAVVEPDRFPEEKNEERFDAKVAPGSRAHMLDFLRAIETKTKPVADISEGVTSSIACILANLSLAAGRSLKWDHAAGKIVNDPEANKLLFRDYREPWVHPGVTQGLV